jgi:hypothetical protein
VNVVSHRQYSLSFFLCPLLATWACSDAVERRSVRGALAASADALEAGDAERFFNLIDDRSRFAMQATVTIRREARQLIEATYPATEKAQALAGLGEAGAVKSAEELFRRRCDNACLHEFSELVGSPREETRSGDEVVVTTVRGTILRMHAGKDGGYGLVWRTEQLSEERAQANRELGQIRDNAATYRRRRDLEQRK